MMRRPAGFDADPRRRQLLKELNNLPPPQLLAQHRLLGRIHTMQLKNTLGRVHSNADKIVHRRPPCLRSTTTSFWHIDAVGGRPPQQPQAFVVTLSCSSSVPNKNHRWLWIPAQGRDDAGVFSASTHAPSSLRTQGPITTGVCRYAEQWHQRARREPSVVMGPGSRPGRRWSFQRFNTRAVVPANAGTHNHRRSLLRGAGAPACSTRTIGGYGSRLKAGTTLEFSALQHTRRRP